LLNISSIKEANFSTQSLCANCSKRLCPKNSKHSCVWGYEYWTSEMPKQRNST